VPVAVRIPSAVWLRAELPRQRQFIAGTGIGGEYAAINSATGEMTPAKYRGRVDIGVNGTYWAGPIIGTLAALLETQYFAGPFQAPPWRAALAEPIPGRDR
jgi:MFS family permease